MTQLPPDSSTYQNQQQESTYRITVTKRDNFHKLKAAKEKDKEWYVGDHEINNGREFSCTSAADVRAIIERINDHRKKGDKIKVQFDPGMEVTYKPTTDSSIEVYYGKTRVMYDGTAMPQKQRKNSYETEISSDVEKPGPSTLRELDFQDTSPGLKHIPLASELIHAVNSIDRSAKRKSRRGKAATETDDSEWEGDVGDALQRDEPLPQRNKVNYRKSRPLSRERKSSSHAREHIDLAGIKTLIKPGHSLKNRVKRDEPGFMQRLFLASTGPTSDEILDMPNTSTRAKLDMIAEHKDSCQKALSMLLRLHLPENAGKGGRDPIMGDIFELRREVLRESDIPIYSRQNSEKAPTKYDKNSPYDLYSDEDKAETEEPELRSPKSRMGIDLAEVASSSAKLV